MNSSISFDTATQKQIQSFGVHAERVPALQSFLNMAWAANKELNLFSRQLSAKDLIENHLIDCLLALPHFPATAKRIADFGTGGGFPGVVYALCFPERKFVLFEKSPKKQDYLTLCRKLAPNIEILGEIPPDLNSVTDPIDLVIARGFKALDITLEVSRSYYLNGGTYFLLKARLEKINEELLLAQKKFTDLQHEVIKLQSPVLEVERHIVLMSRK